MDVADGDEPGGKNDQRQPVDETAADAPPDDARRGDDAAHDPAGERRRVQRLRVGGRRSDGERGRGSDDDSSGGDGRAGPRRRGADRARASAQGLRPHRLLGQLRLHAPSRLSDVGNSAVGFSSFWRHTILVSPSRSW